MRDAIEFEALGIPSAVIIADALYQPADAMRRLSGLPDYPLVATGFPVGSLTETELAVRADAMIDHIVAALTERAPVGQPAPPAPESESFYDEEQALDAFFARGWTDGLPVIVPTAARVERMLAAVAEPAGAVLVEIPTRPGLAIRVRDAAVNAVMAGATPQLFRVVVGALRAMNEPGYNLHAHTGTMAGAQQLIVVNGPSRARWGFHTGNGGLGPGWRANAAVGRAARLALRNALRSVPGEFDRAGFSHPGRYGWCIAEDEARSPWPSIAEQSSPTLAGRDAVTVYATVWQASVINHDPRALPLIDELALVARTSAHANWLHHDVASESSFYAKRPFLFVTGHEHARVLARDGFARIDDLRGALFDRLTAPHVELRPTAIADPANIYVAYLHATGMQQTQFFAPFQSHHLISRPL